MFRSKTYTARRRTALLAGASFLAASLSASVAILAPGAALADECGLTDGNPASADVIQCPNQPYPDGITYTSDGDLTVNLESGITNLGTGTDDVGGLLLTAGNAADSLTATTITSLSTSSSTGTRAPIVIGLETQDGDITLTTGGTVGGVNSVVEYGVYAASSGAGDITIDGGGNIQTGTSSSNPGIAGLFASTDGGDIDIELDGSATGRQYGLRAMTTGAGTLTFTGGASLGTGSNSAGIAGVDVTTEAGLLTLNIDRDVNAAPDEAIGIHMTTGSGDAIINITGGGITAGNNSSADSGSTMAAAIELNMGGGLTTITQDQEDADDSIGVSGTRLWVHDAIRANGSGDIVFDNLSGRIFGQMELSGFDGSFTFTNAGEWTVRGPSNFTSGDTAITNEAGGVFSLGGRDPRGSTDFTLSSDYTALTFGGGSSTFTNNGTIVISVAGTANVLHAQTTELVGLGTFNNAGDVLLGAADEDPAEGTDGFIDDVLIAQGVDFVASEGSRFLMDVDLGVGAGQASCDRAADGTMPAADCVDLSGGTVSGLTLINVVDRVPGDRGAHIPEGIVLVDVTGGSAAGENFALDPTTSSYRAINGGVIDKGMTFYTLAYDDEAQQLKLFGLPNDTALQVPLLIETADQLWRTSAATWFEREGEMRDMPWDSAYGGGVWARTSFNQTEREVSQTVSGAGEDFDFINDHATDSAVFTMGADLISTGNSGQSVVAGAMLGYTRAKTTFDFSPNIMEIDGINAGAYASFVAGEFFASALFNATRLEMHADIPGLELVPASTRISTTISSLGGQLEAGWRWRAGAFGLEPLVALNHIRTTAEDMQIAAFDPIREGLTVTFPEQTSTRGGVGARLTFDSGLGGLRMRYNATGRVWRDFDSETTATMLSSGPDASLSHDLDGEIFDLTAGVVLSNDTGGVSGFLNGGVLAAEGYQNLGVSAGFRYQW